MAAQQEEKAEGSRCSQVPESGRKQSLKGLWARRFAVVGSLGASAIGVVFALEVVSPPALSARIEPVLDREPVRVRLKTVHGAEMTEDPPPEELALQENELRNVKLIGDPKSGTTFTETVAFLAVTHLCSSPRTRASDPSAGLGGAGPCVFTAPADVVQKSRFGIKFPDRKATVLFDMRQKHNYLGARLGAVHCGRGTEVLTPQEKPCSWANFSESDLLGCARQCLQPTPKTFSNLTILMVWRDVRNVVVSRCFTQSNGDYNANFKAMYHLGLEECILRLYPRYVLWARFRRIWYMRSPPNRRLVNICYEGYRRDPRVEYRKIMAVLGLQATESLLDKMMEEARPSRLKDANNSDLRMRLKVRDAGSRTYRDYGLKPALIAWMDSLLDRIAYLEDHPCKEAIRWAAPKLPAQEGREPASEAVAKEADHPITLQQIRESCPLFTSSGVSVHLGHDYSIGEALTEYLEGLAQATLANQPFEATGQQQQTNFLRHLPASFPVPRPAGAPRGADVLAACSNCNGTKVSDRYQCKGAWSNVHVREVLQGAIRSALQAEGLEGVQDFAEGDALVHLRCAPDTLSGPASGMTSLRTLYLAIPSGTVNIGIVDGRHSSHKECQKLREAAVESLRRLHPRARIHLEPGGSTVSRDFARFVFAPVFVRGEGAFSFWAAYANTNQVVSSRNSCPLSRCPDLDLGPKWRWSVAPLLIPSAVKGDQIVEFLTMH